MHVWKVGCSSAQLVGENGLLLGVPGTLPGFVGCGENTRSARHEPLNAHQHATVDFSVKRN
jgi:hypothetical protein